MDRSEIRPEKPYAPGTVADFFSVDPRTVVRWCEAKRRPAFLRSEWFVTPGGHHRIYGRGILRYLDEQGQEERAA